MKSIPRLITLSLLAGCVPSVFPIYGDRDLIFDPALLGVWTNEDSSEIYVVTGTGRAVRAAERGIARPHSYRVAFIDEDCDRGSFVMHLASIDGSKFLDIHPVEPDDEALMLPTHLFFRLDEQVGSVATLRTMNPEWLERYLEHDPEAIEHVKVNGDIVLTATTAELQSFHLEHRQTPDAFDEPGILRRLTDEAAERLTGHFFLSRCPDAFR